MVTLFSFLLIASQSGGQSLYCFGSLLLFATLSQGKHARVSNLTYLFSPAKREPTEDKTQEERLILAVRKEKRRKRRGKRSIVRR